MNSNKGIPLQTDWTAVMRKSVWMAMSGGVDSSVAAYLLSRNAQYNLTGVYMNNWDVFEETGQCTSDKDWSDVQSVCKQLKIPCKRISFVKEYWIKVFEELVKGYSSGRTPNPDILCNSQIKFKEFYNRAKAEGIDYIATGHYAQKSLEISGSGEQRFVLRRAADTSKDQTYFLSHAVNQSILADTLFPLGSLMKIKQVRWIASNAALSTARKEESMGICFIGKRKKFSSFLSQHIPTVPSDGIFIDLDSGQPFPNQLHEGSIFYTIGQSARIGGQAAKYYVAKKDIKSNTVYVVNNPLHPSLLFKQLILLSFHWIDREPSLPLICYVSVRSIDKFGSKAIIHRYKQKYIIEYMDCLEKSVAVGQFAVLYDGGGDGICIGSGEISQTVNMLEESFPLK